jgi:hypothetical protein
MCGGTVLARAYARGMEREGDRTVVPDRDDDLVALEGLEAELADLDDALAQGDRAADGPADPPSGT